MSEEREGKQANIAIDPDDVDDMLDMFDSY